MFTHLLLVKGVNGSVIQDLEDRPLWAKDRFAVVATASIAFLLLDAVDSHIIGGARWAPASWAQGKIGERILSPSTIAHDAASRGSPRTMTLRARQLDRRDRRSPRRVHS